MTLDDVANELYALDPADFVSTRTERVKEARAQKDRALAAAIGKLRKPTTVGWVVNLLSHSLPDDVAELLELGDALREAQSHLSGAALRTLTKQRQRAVRGLAERAGELAADRGTTVTDDVLREVGQTLNAALADDDVTELVRSGRVLGVIEYSGFGPAGLIVVPDTPETPETPGPGDHDEKDRESAENDTFDRDHRDAEAELDEARTAAAQAQSALDDAEEAVQTIRARIDDLRAELRRAEEELQFADASATSAKSDSDAAVERVTVAERALAALP